MPQATAAHNPTAPTKNVGGMTPMTRRTASVVHGHCGIAIGLSHCSVLLLRKVRIDGCEHQRCIGIFDPGQFRARTVQEHRTQNG